MSVQSGKLAAVFGLLSCVAHASQVEVVLAHHSEDLSWLSMIPKDVHLHVYTKGPQVPEVPLHSGVSLQRLPNVGRESHTYLNHIVENYNVLADWTVFSQAGAPSFGYKGHRSGGGHLLAGDDFLNYLMPRSSGSRFVYTAVVHLPSMDHLLRAAYCIDDELLEGGGAHMCPKESSQWTPWWDIGDFRKFVSNKAESQHGEEIMDFYRKYINPAHTEGDVIAFFPQGARFAVSRETVHRRPKADYERLLATLYKDQDPYAGYYMEWLWSELFLGHQKPCSVPAKRAPVSHAEAMASLAERFQNSAERQLSVAQLPGSSTVSGGSSGAISGGISGGVSGGVSGGMSTTAFATTTTTTAALVKVAGTMEVEIYLQGLLSQDAVEQMFRRSLASSLDITIQHVVKLSVSLIYNELPRHNLLGSGKGPRRLQLSLLARQYEVAYEVIVPSSMDPDVIVSKANRVIVPGTAESQVFRQGLIATDGVVQVRKVAMKIGAHVLDETAASSPSTQADQDDDKKGTPWRSVAIGVTASLMVLLCLVPSIAGMRRMIILFKEG